MKSVVTKFIFIILFIFGIVACSGSGGGDPTGGDSGPNNTTINGMASEEFYGQFVYTYTTKKVDGNLVESHSHTIANWEKINSTTISFIKLYLMADKSFIIEYQECRTTPNSSSCIGDFSFEDVLKGKWRVSGTTLIIGSIAKGEGLEYNEEEAVNVQFMKNLGADGLTSTIFLFRQRKYGDAPPET